MQYKVHYTQYNRTKYEHRRGDDVILVRCGFYSNIEEE